MHAWPGRDEASAGCTRAGTPRASSVDKNNQEGPSAWGGDAGQNHPNIYLSTSLFGVALTSFLYHKITK